ncbi:Bro-N domain-containing protein, partial [Pseudoalteromonas sp. SIMBA_153]
MNQLQQIFNYQNHDVRTVFQDGQPWFVAKDVCEILGIKNATQAISKLDIDERAMLNIGRQGNT